ncbi:MAG TPA: M20 family metallopeptidase [Candidatus Aquilonibacter sp.]|nr:M20 family metallopeptidase [Candidatus Aquilonibacter sp.]
MKNFVDQVSAAEPRLRARLRELVEIESPSDNPEAVNRAADRVADWARELGAEVRRHPGGTYGDVLELRFGARAQGKPVLVLGHLDTVYPMGTLKTMPWREVEAEDGVRLMGPGVVDMKAGVVMALEAVAALRELKAMTRPVTVLLNPDEEVGSEVSRPHTERLARESEAVFVLEPAQGVAYKTARKGVGHFELTVEGVAAHAGVDFASGHSAVLEMARLAVEVSGWTDLSKGRTVNVGVIAGGTRSNVIAAHCKAEVDARVVTMEDAARVEEMFRTLRTKDAACTLRVEGGINRPPMERSAGTVALFQRAQILAAEIGLELQEASTGGGSDGNFTAAIGVPTLDGMGAIGGGAHSPGEFVVASHLVERTALLAAMLQA